MDRVVDLAIIGGGINGCGCAADAALRGLSVVLFEKDDLASKTSSSSTKLIHGGLRYLEHYEFSLVKKALLERQRLLDLAPHLVHAQAFVLPLQKHRRPAWFIRLGLFFYDHLTHKNHLPSCKSIRRSAKSHYFAPLKDELKRGFLFYDAATEDARLTICNALQAKDHGASIRPHSCVVKTEVIGKLWQLTIKPKKGSQYTLLAKSIMNAAGPWVESMAQMTQISDQQKISLVKGSHMIVPALYEGDQAYFLQHTDDRVVFVIPYHGFSMIGTTEVPFSGSPDEVKITDEEIDYLTHLVNSYFKVKISREDLLYSWSGVRPLLANENKDANALSRDYSYTFHTLPAPCITLYGGKITTYRQLAQEAIDQLKVIFPQMRASTTKTTPLPGATYSTMNFEEYVLYAKEQYRWLDEALLNRYLYTYGTKMEYFLSQCTSMASMGKHFGESLYQVEVDYLLLEEWASCAQDILRRRTQLGLTMSKAGEIDLATYCSS